MSSPVIMKEFFYGLGLAFAIEAVTMAIRFGMGRRAARDTAFLAQFTGGWRIHHLYPGVLLLLTSPALRAGTARSLCVVVGLALVISDLAHHFIVLKLITGCTEFDLRYPPETR